MVAAGIKKGILKKETTIALIFMMYLFIHMSVSVMCIKNSTGIVSETEQFFMYYINQIFLVAGFFVFPIAWNRITEDGKRAMLLKGVAAGFFLLCFLIMLYQVKISFIVLSPLAHLFLGIIGGAINYFLAVAMMGTSDMGKLLALAATGALALQYIIQIVTDNSLLLLMFIMSFAAVVVAIVRQSWEWILLDCVPDVNETGNNDVKSVRGSIATAVVISVFAVLLLTYYDSMLIRMMVESELQVSAYSWPRLFAVVGYMIIGVIGDIKQRRYVNLTMVFLLFWLMLSPIIFADNPVSNLNMALFYVVIGALMCYMYLMFWSLAPLTGKNVTIVPSFGRIIDGAAGVVFSMIPWGSMSTIALIILFIASIIIILAALFINGDFLLADKQEARGEKKTELKKESVVKEDREIDVLAIGRTEAGAEKKKPVEVDILSEMSKEYGLTEREFEVLEKLIFTEDSGQEIADALYISRRVFQKHVASIYEKTGTKSRVGLYQKYHQQALRMSR